MAKAEKAQISKKNDSRQGSGGRIIIDPAAFLTRLMFTKHDIRDNFRLLEPYLSLLRYFARRSFFKTFPTRERGIAKKKNLLGRPVYEAQGGGRFRAEMTLSIREEISSKVEEPLTMKWLAP